MPGYNKKANKNRGTRNAGAKSNTKNQVGKIVVSKVDDDEGHEPENQKFSSSGKREALRMKNPTKTLVFKKYDEEDQASKREYVTYCVSSDEERFDEIRTKPELPKSEKNGRESDDLHDSIKNITITQHMGTMTRSRSQSVSMSKEIEKELIVKLEKLSEEKASSASTSTKKQGVISTPLRRTRHSSATSNVGTDGFGTPHGTPTSSRTRRNLRTQSPVKSTRHLRERNIVNYKEQSSSVDEKPPVAKTKVKKNQECHEKKLFETPRKSDRLKGATPSRKSLAAVNEEIHENDPSSLEDFTRNSREKLVEKRSSRIQKRVAGRKSYCVYDEGSPKKLRSTITNTPTTRSLTPSTTTSKKTQRTSTPGRKKAVTPERNVATPKKSIAASPRRGAAVTPRGRLTLTPGMHKRSAYVPKPQTNFQEFRARLHVSFVPKSLPCREAEFNNIFTFLQCKLTEETGGCIYISGVPGTGKTATVNEVISCLKKLVSQGELPSFQFIDINGMKLTEPHQVYVQIQKLLNGVTTSWEEAYGYLHQRFTTPDSRRTMTLLLIDEMDLLCTKRQDVVYNLLNWPTYKSSRLVVITIANTMDLPERVLMGRVTSRLGLTRLTFQPYNHLQLMEIVKTRLKESEAFKSEAIELVSRKVASVSGDARRALDICRRATEIAENNNKDCVTMGDVTSALKEMIANPRVQAIKSCSIMEQKFLEAVCTEVTRTGVDQVTFKSIYVQFETLCRLDGLDVPNITQALEICRKLASWRLILQECGADLYQSILLNVSVDDVYYSRQKLS